MVKNYHYYHQDPNPGLSALEDVGHDLVPREKILEEEKGRSIKIGRI